MDEIEYTTEGILPAHIEDMTETELTAYLLAGDDDVFPDDRMAGPDDDRPHPDGA
jgi:hypothetical protein